MCLQAKGAEGVRLGVAATGQVYKQIIFCLFVVHLGGAIREDGDLGVETKRRVQKAWSCFRHGSYSLELYYKTARACHHRRSVPKSSRPYCMGVTWSPTISKAH